MSASAPSQHQYSTVYVSDEVESTLEIPLAEVSMQSSTSEVPIAGSQHIQQGELRYGDVHHVPDQEEGIEHAVYNQRHKAGYETVHKVKPDQESCCAEPSWHEIKILLPWWKEIVAIVVSIVLLVAIYSLLEAYDGKDTSSWTPLINLTTLIALFSTISRMALITVAAEVISQAKYAWLWAPSSRSSSGQTQGRPLSDLQAFDQASRGPLGSILLFRTVWRNPVLITTLVVMVVSVAMGPFAQQSVRTVVCQYADTFASASITNMQTLGYHDTYNGWYQKPTYTYQPLGYMARAAALSSFADPNGTDSRMQFTCTSGNCTFQEYTNNEGRNTTHSSIAFCSRCVDISDQIRVVITNTTQSWHNAYESPTIPISTHHNWSLPNGQYIEHAQGEKEYYDVMSLRSNGSVDWAPKATTPEFLKFSRFSLLNISSLIAEAPFDTENTTKHAAICTLYPCINSYRASIDQGELYEVTVSSEQLTPYGNEYPNEIVEYRDSKSRSKIIFPSESMQVQDPCLVKGLVYTQANLSSAPGAKTLPRLSYHATDRLIYADSEEMDEESKPRVNITAPPECLFGMDQMTWMDELRAFLQDNVANGKCNTGGSDEVVLNKKLVCDPYLLKALYNNGATFVKFERYMQDFAAALTRRFRMGVDRTDTASDDYGYNMTQVTGIAWHTTTCFKVDSRWLLFPSVLTGLTAGILIWTLVRGRHHAKTGQVTWKSSLLPLLFYKEHIVAMNREDGRLVAGEEGDRLLSLSALDKEAKRTRVVFQPL